MSRSLPILGLTPWLLALPLVVFVAPFCGYNIAAAIWLVYGVILVIAAVRDAFRTPSRYSLLYLVYMGELGLGLFFAFIGTYLLLGPEQTATLPQRFADIILDETLRLWVASVTLSLLVIAYAIAFWRN